MSCNTLHFAPLHILAAKAAGDFDRANCLVTPRVHVQVNRLHVVVYAVDFAQKEQLGIMH